MLTLPPMNSPIRELFDIADLAYVAHPDRVNDLPMVRAFARAVQPMFADKATSSIHGICLTCEGDIALIRVEAGGITSRVWTFSH